VLGQGANPILRCSGRQGGSRRLKPDKRPSHEKIDAVVGLAMALDGVIRQPLHTGSVYDTRGVLFI
jgi:hypothetical protein